MSPERIDRLPKWVRKEIEQLRCDRDDYEMAAQTIFYRCACGRMAERGVMCPTNQRGGKCEAGR